MGVVYVSTEAPLTVGAYDHGGYVLDSVVGECIQSVGSGQYVEDLSVPTVGNGYAIAYERPAGRGDLADGIRVLIDGDDWTDRIADGVTITMRSAAFSERSSSAPVRRADFALHAASCNYLDSAAVTTGKSVVIDARVKKANGGGTILRRVFTGVIRDPDFEANATSEHQRVRCSDYAEDLEENFSLNIRCSGQLRGGVIVYVGDRYELTTTGSATTVTLGSGAGYVYGPRYVEHPETTLDLSTFPNLTLDDPEELGHKSIFVNRYGSLDAADGPAPADGIALWNFELDYVGQPLTESIFGDERSFIVKDEDKTRGGLARIFLFLKGVANWDQLRLPTTNDERVQSDIIWDDRPFNELMTQWGEPALWRWRYGVDGIPEYVYSHTPLAGYAKAHYTINHAQMVTLRPASKSTAVAEQRVTGRLTINNGLTGRWEGSTIKVTGELTESEGGSLNGEIQPYGGGKTRKVVLSITRERTYIKGDQPDYQYHKRQVRKNPLDYKCASNTVIGKTDGPIANSTERGFNYLHDKARLEDDEKTTVNYLFRGRVQRGTQTKESRMFNPENLAGGIHYDRDELNAPPGGTDEVHYGFDGEEESLRTVRVINEFLRTDTSAKIRGRGVETFDLQNPQRNGIDPPPGFPTITGTHGQPMHAVRYVLPSPQLMKTNETQTRYTQITPRDMRIRSITRNWSKKPGSTAHATGSVGGSSNSPMGHTQGRTEGPTTVSSQTKRGRLEYAATQQDDIDVIPVGYTVFSSSIAAALDVTRAGTPVEHPFCETPEQCERVARRIFGEVTGDEWCFDVGWNPSLEADDPVQVDLTTRGRRVYKPLMLAAMVAHTFPVDPAQEPTTRVTGIVSHNAIKAVLATRT